MRRRGASARCPVCRKAHPEELETTQGMMDQACEFYVRGSFEQSREWGFKALDLDPNSTA